MPSGIYKRSEKQLIFLKKLGKQQRGKNNLFYKHGKCAKYDKKINYCIDCGIEISFGHKRCISCSVTGKNNPFYGKKHTKKIKKINSIKHKGEKSYFYIHGKTLKKYYCIDCEREISYRAKRCRKCSNKKTYKLRIKNLQKAVGSYMQNAMYKVIKRYFCNVKYNYFVKTKNWRFLDVAIPKLMLDFEYNGMRHEFTERIKSDKIRTKELNNLGWTVIIIDKNNFKDLKYILEEIKRGNK